MSGTGRLLPPDDAEIESVLLDRPIVSLTDVAYAYGRLDALHVAERFRGIEFDVPDQAPPWVEPDISDDHLLAMTPDAKSELFDEGDAVITLNIVLSPDPDTPPRFYDETTHVERVDWSGMIRHGYAYRKKRGLVYDHSLATHVNGKSAEKDEDEDKTDIDRFVTSRFEKWPIEKVDEEIMARDDAWIVKGLAAIGNDEELHSTAVEAVRQIIRGFDGSTWEGILSVKLWFDIDSDGDENGEVVGPFTPGLVPICNEVAIANLRDQYTSYSAADDPVSDGVDAVTGEETMVLGTSPERPLEYYQGKQQGPFDGFDADRSVQNQTISMTTAMAVSAGSSLIASCGERIGGRSESIKEFDVYYLPYVPVMDANDARAVYAMISAAHRDSDPIAMQLAETIDTFAAPRDLRFHQVLINTGVEANKDKVIAENLAASLMPVAALAREHTAMLADCPIDLDRYDWVDMFDAERSQVVPILTGEYLSETMYDPDRHVDETRYDPDRHPNDFTTGANDPRVKAFASIVTGELTSGDLLLEEYVKRLVQDQRGLLGDSGRDCHIPYDTIAAQYVQCNALDHAGLICGEPPYPILTMTDTNRENETESETDSEPANRDAKLERYLQNHALLNEGSNGDAAMRASFLLGGLVGRVSAYQQNEGVQSPISRRYTIDSITRANFRSVFAGAAAKSEEYAFAYNDGQVINQRYIRRLRDLLTNSNPKEWSTTEATIQAAYATGLSYARGDTSDSPETEQDETNETGAEADIEA